MRFARRVVMVLLSLFCCLGLNIGHASNGGIYTDLFNFAGTNGAAPEAALTLSGGVFYGTTTSGGMSNGVIFSFDASTSTYTPLVNFTGDFGNFPGHFPFAALTLSGGVFYGTTQSGGMYGYGVLFSFDPSTSAYMPLYNFNLPTGATPFATLTLSGGVFYGTTQSGGMSGNGVLFSFDPSTSIYTPLVNFTGNISPDFGSFPQAALTLNGGILYGTTVNGGASGNGVIFSFDPLSSTYMRLYDFDGTHGSNPATALTLSGGVFYGTTTSGVGSSSNGVIFSFDPSSSTYMRLYDFDGTHGANPQAALTLNSGVFYGTTASGGASHNGVIFSFDPSTSTYIDLYDFDNTRGSAPLAALTLSDGILYGTTTGGGANSLGVIFSFAPLLPPSNLTGRQKKNDSGARYEWFNDLKWQPPTLSGTVVASYNIYRDGKKIATLPPSTLHYEDHNRKKGVKTLYSVTTINVQGTESNSVNITVP